jgi:hypothetical protein
MMKLTRMGILSAGLASALVAGCGGSKEMAKEQHTMAKKQMEQADEDREKSAAKEEEAKKEKEAQEALVGPIKAGEFRLTLSPDAGAKSSYAIPVHVISGRADVMRAIRANGVDNYWQSPNPRARKAVFGTTGSTGAETFSVPSSPGHDMVVIIAKLPAPARGETRIMEIPLKREPNPSDAMRPLTPSKSVRISLSGVSPN